MMLLSPQEQAIDNALHANLTALKEGFLDFLAGLLLCIIALISVLHAVIRMLFAGLGLLLWSLALSLTFLYWLRDWAVSRSASSIHRREHGGR
jgi:hypothetical protein